MDKTKVTITLTVDKVETFRACTIRTREVVETTVGLDEQTQQRVEKFQKFKDKIRRALNVTAAA